MRITDLKGAVTAALIKRGRGIARRRPDDKPFHPWWADYKGEEKALEEAKYARCTRGHQTRQAFPS